MRLKKVEINNFKRFTKLTVEGIPESARLIILAGPNGCGKSSFFDALQVWRRFGAVWDEDYHFKIGCSKDMHPSEQIQAEFHNSVNHQDQDPRKSIYIRSAYRNNPELRVSQLSQLGNPLDQIKVSRMIDNDTAVTQNYQMLVSQTLEDVYGRTDGSTTIDDYRKEQLKDIRESLLKLFPALRLDDLGNPLEDGTFRFTKGESKGFSFKNLSAGEKASFDLVLDIVIARRNYDDTIFCIDEPESHLNARLQSELLSVLYNLVPENCQLMLA